jgi:hypothetical protein
MLPPNLVELEQSQTTPADLSVSFRNGSHLLDSVNTAHSVAREGIAKDGASTIKPVSPAKSWFDRSNENLGERRGRIIEDSK